MWQTLPAGWVHTFESHYTLHQDLVVPVVAVLGGSEPYSRSAESGQSLSYCTNFGLMAWQMCTRAGAGLQQICAEKHSLIHTLLVWRSSVPGAQRCGFRMSPQRIGK